MLTRKATAFWVRNKCFCLFAQSRVQSSELWQCAIFYTDTNILGEHVVRMRCEYFFAGCKEGGHSDPWEGRRLYVSPLPQITECPPSMQNLSWLHPHPTHFDPEDGGDTLLQTVCIHIKYYMVSRFRRPWPELLLLWKPGNIYTRETPTENLRGSLIICYTHFHISDFPCFLPHFQGPHVTEWYV
jgi:hypothetical protein